MDCAELSDYVLKRYHLSLAVIREIIRDGNMTTAEIMNWRISALPSGGGSMQPGFSLSLKKDEKDTLANVLKRNQAWELREMFGDNWQHDVMVFRNRSHITVYRASIYPIIPGSYVTESRQYALDHREYVNAPEYHIYSVITSPSSLVWMGDPHEFLFVPSIEEWKEIAQRTMQRFPVELRKEIMNCTSLE